MKNGKKSYPAKNIKLFIQFWIGDKEQFIDNPSGKILMDGSYRPGPQGLNELRSLLVRFFEKVIRLILDLTSKISEANSEKD
jgi:hypothetical protein